MKQKPLSNKSGKIRELKEKDINAMKSASAVLPAELLDILPKRKRGERGTQKSPKKILVTVRYSPEVIRYFKSTGAGWQVRIDTALKNYIKKKGSDRAA
ncbi:hypothetical protein AYO45_01690 [Gammaproteobacteria bacterium SCGC AG-212-F23]|nr:hypothetical protein AYO45_01690 [Gammaproteobacteria bacterium SCGC AG-212-F23]